MSSVLPTAPESARKMLQVVLQALAENGRAVAIAASLGISESTISRLKNEHLETLCAVLAHAGLKIVPAESRVIAPDRLRALLTFAKAHLNGVDSIDEMSD